MIKIIHFHFERQKRFYEWRSNVPRDEFIRTIPSREMSAYYRKGVVTLRNNLPENEETMVLTADQCFLAGIEPADLDTIFSAVLIEENNHTISSAIRLYNAIIEYAETVTADELTKPS